MFLVHHLQLMVQKSYTTGRNPTPSVSIGCEMKVPTYQLGVFAGLLSAHPFWSHSILNKSLYNRCRFPKRKSMTNIPKLVGGWTTHSNNIIYSNWIISSSFGVKIKKQKPTPTQEYDKQYISPTSFSRSTYQIIFQGSVWQTPQARTFTKTSPFFGLGFWIRSTCGNENSRCHGRG